jgi:hypothetical protein
MAGLMRMLRMSRLCCSTRGITPPFARACVAFWWGAGARTASPASASIFRLCSPRAPCGRLLRRVPGGAALGQQAPAWPWAAAAGADGRDAGISLGARLSPMCHWTHCPAPGEVLQASNRSVMHCPAPGEALQSGGQARAASRRKGRLPWDPETLRARSRARAAGDGAADAALGRGRARGPGQGRGRRRARAARARPRRRPAARLPAVPAPARARARLSGAARAGRQPRSPGATRRCRSLRAAACQRAAGRPRRRAGSWLRRRSVARTGDQTLHRALAGRRPKAKAEADVCGCGRGAGGQRGGAAAGAGARRDGTARERRRGGEHPRLATGHCMVACAGAAGVFQACACSASAPAESVLAAAQIRISGCMLRESYTLDLSAASAS